jgi:long-chain acyl-CoA synthetase
MGLLPQRMLGETLFRTNEKHHSKIAIIVKQQEYTYSQLRESSKKIASYLVKNGLKKGDRVAVYMNNSWQSIVSIYGISLAGGVFMTINPQTRANKLQYILNDSEANFLIAESLLKNEISIALKDVKYLEEVIISGNSEQIRNIEKVRLTSFEKILTSNDIDIILPQVIPNDLAALIYTSGSTGFPKGVMMSHQNMVFTLWSLIEYLRLSEEDRILLLLPLAFDYGLYQLLMAVAIGGTLIVEQSFIFPASVYKTINHYKPTVFPGVPTIYALMIATHKKSGICFESILKITNTAAALPSEFIPDLKKIFPNALIFKMYGLTECKRVCYLEPELVDVKPESVGKAIPGTEVFLLSPEGKPVPPNEPGILHIRGPHVMLGYWKRDDLSKEMLKPGVLPYERILCSNDWFKMDEDGFLYFLGRNDDIIKTRGEKVSPLEIEKIIYSINGIKEVAVFGIPDEIMGEAIVACVTLYESIELVEKDIQKECMIHLELFMIPQKVYFVVSMPKSPNGKIDKKELKQMILQDE